MPFFSPSSPPFTISQITSAPSMRSTRSSISPSDSRIREPGSRFSASVVKTVPTRSAVPSIFSGVIVMRCPATSCTDTPPTRRPVRIFGPCRSARMQIGLPNSLETIRTMRIRSAFCSCEPCEKFSRATSRPARTSSRKTSGVLEAGPSVATIFARRRRSTEGSGKLAVAAGLIEASSEGTGAVVMCLGPISFLVSSSSFVSLVWSSSG